MKLPTTGRPPFAPTAEQRAIVTALQACGVRQELIAEKLAIDRKTLRKHFYRELKSGMADANARIATTLYQKALGGNIVAMLFWLKCRAGWKEVAGLELTGKDGAPLKGARPPPTLGDFYSTVEVVEVHDPDEDPTAPGAAH